VQVLMSIQQKPATLVNFQHSGNNSG